MNKVKEIMASKAAKSALMIAGLLAIMCVSAFAAESPDAMAGITASLTEGFTKVAGDILKLIGVAIVAVMGVIGAKVAVKAAIGFFKGMSKGG